jgi:phenylalanyl-tRNA synthetase beta subunit
VLNNPVGYDIAQMVVYRNNLSNDIFENPLFREKTIAELLGDKLSASEMEQIIKKLSQEMVKC